MLCEPTTRYALRFMGKTIEKRPEAPFMQSVVVFGRCHLMEAGEKAAAFLKRFALNIIRTDSW